MVHKWLGPYKIVEAKDKGNYRLRNLSTNTLLASMVNVARLKKYQQPLEESESPTKRQKTSSSQTKKKTDAKANMVPIFIAPLLFHNV